MGQDVEIVDVSMRFGDIYAVRNINVHIEAGEFFSFLGPSGCGKTTLLRLVSGFMDPTKGQIKIDGKDMIGIGSNNRPTAMIFKKISDSVWKCAACPRRNELKRWKNSSNSWICIAPGIEKSVSSPAGRCSEWPSPELWR